MMHPLQALAAADNQCGGNRDEKIKEKLLEAVERYWP